METKQPSYLNVKFQAEVWHDEPAGDQPKDFFDREEEIRKALDVLLTPGVRQAVWIVGERRAGKTSLLRLLLEKCRQKGLVAFEVPWQVIHSPEDFYREYLSGLAKALGTEFGAIATERSVFLQEIERLRAEAKDKVIVLAVDEIDAILDSMQELQQKEIIGAIQRLVDININCKIIISSARKPEHIEGAKASPLIRQSVPIFLSPFEKQDLDKLIDFYWPSSSDDKKQQIYDLSGGWPYYAKAILYHLLQIPADQTDRWDVATREAVQSIAPVCEYLYRHHCDHQEKRALLLLTRQEVVKESDLEALGAEARLAFKLLVERGYLQVVGGEYRFRVKLIEMWFRQWIHRELQEEAVGLEKWLSKLAWQEEPDEKRIEVTKDELRRRGF